MQAWQLLAASKTITIHTSESQSGMPLAQYNPHRGIVNCAVYNHTGQSESKLGKVIASCGQDGKIALHSAQRCQDKLLQLSYHTGQQDPSSINCCMFSPKSKFIAAGSVNSTVKVWDMKSNKEKQALHKLKGHAGAVTSIAWINNQQIIASSSTSGDILMHDVSTGAIRDSLTSRLQEGINNIKVSQGEAYKRLAACTNSGSLMVWDVNISTKKPIFTYQDPKKASYTCLSISTFSPVLMVCSSIDSSLLFMDINERRVIKNVATEEPLTSIAFNQDGQILAAGGMSGGLMIYDLRKIQTPLFKLNGHDTPIKSVCFSEKEKDKDKQKDRAKLKERTDYGTGSNYSKSSVGDLEKDKSKVLQVVSTSKLQVIEDKDKNNNNKVMRNLTKKQQPQPPKQEQKPIPTEPQKPTTIPSSTPTYTPVGASSATTTLNRASTSYTQPTISQYQYQNQHQNQYQHQYQNQSQEPGNLKQLQEKLIGEMKNMEMRMNQKFQMLHLEVIRQMQLSVEKISNCFDKKIGVQRDLENKIRQLQEENQNLKKRTF